MIIMCTNPEHHYQLASIDTQRVVLVGRLIHHTDGTAWRVDRIDHIQRVVMVSRHTNCGRQIRYYTPEALRCELRIDTEFYVDKRRMENWTKFLIVQGVLLTVGAFIAWYLTHILGA